MMRRLLNKPRHPVGSLTHRLTVASYLDAVSRSREAGMTLFLEARHNQCRRPLWADGAPLDRTFVCGAPAVPGRSYCTACRARLVAGTARHLVPRSVAEGPELVLPAFQIAAE